MNPDTEYFKEAIINKLKNIDIPDWVKYVAVDRNGEVWGYNIKPFILDLDLIGDCWNITCKGCDKCKHLFNLDSECILCWKDLIIEWNENIESQ